MKLFKKKNTSSIDPTEDKFDTMMDLIKDLPRADYNRLKAAMDLGYDAYQKVRNVKSMDADIVASEKKLDLMEEK